MWAWIATIFLSQVDCLGYFDPLQPVQTPLNHPPYIIWDSIDPKQEKVIIPKTQTTTTTTGFRVFTVGKALDFDRADTLYGVWVLDYQDNSRNALPCRSNTEQKPQKDFDPQRAREINFTCRIVFAEQSQLVAGKTSLLTFYLLDRKPNIEDVLRPPNGQLTWPDAENHHVASRSWALQVE